MALRYQRMRERPCNGDASVLIAKVRQHAHGVLRLGVALDTLTFTLRTLVPYDRRDLLLRLRRLQRGDGLIPVGEG